MHMTTFGKKNVSYEEKERAGGRRGRREVASGREREKPKITYSPPSKQSCDIQ